MVRVGILGATGYTALELIKILLRHPEVEIAALTTRQEDRPHVASIHRQLAGRLDLTLENSPVQEIAERVDCVFCCLPHAASAAVIAEYLAAGVRVVDFSADYRLNDAETYAQWYGGEHPDAERVGMVPYGLPELFRSEIKSAALVANPGCFPTSAILALAPLVKAGKVQTRDIIIDSKTGVSGGGRTPKLPFHFPECNESVMAYNLGKHRHMPEIDQILSRAYGQPAEVIFTPHLIPMDRGILSTVYASPVAPIDRDEVMRCLGEFYQDEPFVRVVDQLPTTKDTLGTNYCDLSAECVRGRIVVISCIDNLIKGASGAAVQNFNLMFELDETTALLV